MMAEKMYILTIISMLMVMFLAAVNMSHFIAYYHYWIRY